MTKSSKPTTPHDPVKEAIKRVEAFFNRRYDDYQKMLLTEIFQGSAVSPAIIADKIVSQEKEWPAPITVREIVTQIGRRTGGGMLCEQCGKRDVEFQRDQNRLVCLSCGWVGSLERSPFSTQAVEALRKKWEVG